jgi:hypothetical protein
VCGFAVKALQTGGIDRFTHRAAAVTAKLTLFTGNVRAKGTALLNR